MATQLNKKKKQREELQKHKRINNLIIVLALTGAFSGILFKVLEPMFFPPLNIVFYTIGTLSLGVLSYNFGFHISNTYGQKSPYKNYVFIAWTLGSTLLFTLLFFGFLIIEIYYFLLIGTSLIISIASIYIYMFWFLNGGFYNRNITIGNVGNSTISINTNHIEEDKKEYGNIHWIFNQKINSVENEINRASRNSYVNLIIGSIVSTLAIFVFSSTLLFNSNNIKEEINISEKNKNIIEILNQVKYFYFSVPSESKEIVEDELWDISPIHQEIDSIYANSINRNQYDSIISSIINVAINKPIPKQKIDSATKFIFISLPRISIILLIQIIAFFFLRLYRKNLAEIKYFNNEKINILSKIAAYQIAKDAKNDKAIETIIQTLSNTERNSILKDGESTKVLQYLKMENENDYNLYTKFKGWMNSSSKNSL